MIHTLLSQGASGEVPRFKTVVSLVTMKVRPLEAAMGVLGDIPEKVPELEMIPCYGPSVCHSFFFYREQLIKFRGSLARTLNGDFAEAESVVRDKLPPASLQPVLSEHTCFYLIYLKIYGNLAF